MSRENDEKKYLKGSSRGKGQPSKGNAGLFSFHPTKAQKEEIKAGKDSLETALATICTYAEDGCKISIGFSAAKLSYYVIIRTGEEDWELTRSISAWHIDPATAVFSLAYALKKVATEYPEFLPKMYEHDNNW